jgi:hypothetical protein
MSRATGPDRRINPYRDDIAAAYLRGEVLDGAPRMRAAAANAAAPAVVHDSAADDALGALDTALL